ncbi:hypothetical protein MMC21_000164 [Puttea exsequens]|nr:hypothetical protein [Puttea exsequens]
MTTDTGAELYQKMLHAMAEIIFMTYKIVQSIRDANFDLVAETWAFINIKKDDELYKGIRETLDLIERQASFFGLESAGEHVWVGWKRREEDYSVLYAIQNFDRRHVQYKQMLHKSLIAEHQRWFDKMGALGRSFHNLYLPYLDAGTRNQRGG